MFTPAPGTSIVVSTYNRPDGAASLVQALLDQQGYEGPLEILLVNDHGDETVFPKVRLVSAGQAIPVRCFDTGYSGFGVVIARNIGLRFSRYSTTIFLDDDITIKEDLVARYQRAPDGLRLGRVNFQMKLNGQPQIIKDRREIMEGADRSVEPYQRYLGYLWGANFAVPTALGLAVGGFDELFLNEDEEDMDFGARVILASRRLVTVPSAVAIHHGPDAVLKKQQGIPFIERPHRGNIHFQERGHLVANGGVEYWQSARWNRYLR